jgi:hypothetical protein
MAAFFPHLQQLLPWYGWYNINKDIVNKRIVMKSIRFCEKIRMLAVPFVACVLLASCARKIQFTNSNVVPAAQGTVKLKRDNNNNYAVHIDVKNLAAPDRLQPPKSVYVVWFETAGRSAQNLGQLKTSSGLFSDALKASLNAVSPFKPTRIFITAEDRADIEYPGSFVVLNTTSF